MSITAQTRRESYYAVLQSLNGRQKNVLEILRDYGDCTAQEVAAILYLRKLAHTDERNAAAPRLTELADMGFVQAVDKKVCGKTGRRVTVWSVAVDEQ